jgi:carbamoyl-phosphate synthase large subunit
LTGVKKEMKNEFNILISSAGRRVSLLKLFKRAMIKLNLKGLIYAVDIRLDAPAIHVADEYQIMPKVTDKSYIEKLIKYCIEKKISLVIPTIDTELCVFSKAKARFEKYNIKVLISSNQFNITFTDKLATHLFFEKNQITSPKYYTFDEAKKLSFSNYPLILKPNYGSGSIGVTKVNNLKELIFFSAYLNKPLIQEFIEGNEYTIDTLVDFSGKIRCVVPRLRIETRAGEVSKAVTVNDSKIIQSVYEMSDALRGASGCITIQCIKKKNKDIKFIEINPRFGGGFPLSAEAGADYPLFILKMLINANFDRNLQDSWLDGYSMLRYDDAIFIDSKSFKL